MVEKIRAYTDVITQHLYTSESVIRRESFSSNTMWTPLPSRFIVISSDAAVFPDINMSGAGAVALNHEGIWVVTFTEPLQAAIKPELAEAMALRRDVQLACDEHFSNVIFATDCQSLVNMINATTFDRSIIGTVVNDIKVASRIFDSVEFKYVRRQVNVAAHILAKSCKYLSNLVVFHSAPECTGRLFITLF